MLALISHPKLKEVLHREAENALLAARFTHVYMFRPAAVHGTPKHVGPVFENRDVRAMVASLE